MLGISFLSICVGFEVGEALDEVATCGNKTQKLENAEDAQKHRIFKLHCPSKILFIDT